jgi:type I restriction enzyme M protein
MNRLTALGFSPTEVPNILVSDTTYPIKVRLNEVNFVKSTIDYGEKIKIHHSSSSNFSDSENFVVLECVIRLLRKGYPADRIQLEKTWKLGHRGKGRLDILLLDAQGKAFSMIECKTWGQKYAIERDNTLEDGGQLFSYFVQDRNASFLILYTSTINVSQVSFKAEGIAASLLSGDNLDDLFRSWDKSFVLNSIFDNNVATYASGRGVLLKRDLLELDRDSGKGVFNSFAEILRRNVVSDKSNAFNKIFNLFVCKIYDEDTKTLDQKLEFQWNENDTFDIFLSRLADLYKHGIEDYLGIVTDTGHFSALSEFSFIDVYNDATFSRNSQILREVVELLQTYRIKYSGKHQFLGDFFEKLLATGIKQEVGQFFTPIPLARFILKSIPLDVIIENNISQHKTHILPYILDFACGSGHFLTEAIDEVDEFAKNVDATKIIGLAKSRFESERQNYLWAKEYIYGIEKDYRLAKTTKVAMFLNGDGEANVINGDGLDDFHDSATYIGKLHTNKKQALNESFDVVAANPPFSVTGFKRYLHNGSDNFSLYPFLSAKSSEIECLFIERLGQLLKEGGYAGIILPLSILNNEQAIYAEARKKLLILFQIHGVVELREKTFIATPTTTVILFLRKRTTSEIKSALQSIQDYFVEEKIDPTVEETFNSVNGLFFKGNLTKKEVKAQITGINIKSLFNTYTQAKTTSLESPLIELIVHYLNHGRNTVIAFSGEKKEQEQFLGYRFSSSRGNEGLHILTENGSFAASTYNPQDVNDAEKVNAHIRACFEGRELEIPEQLQGYASWVNTDSLLTDNKSVIKNPSAYLASPNIVIESLSPIGDLIDDFENETVNLAEMLETKQLTYISGLIYNKTDEVPRPTSRRVLTASNIDRLTAKLIMTNKIIYLRDDFSIIDILIPRPNDIIISNASGSLSHLGKVCYIDTEVEAMIGGFLSILRCNSEELSKAFFYRLLSLRFRKFVVRLKDQNINNMNLNELHKFQFTIPVDLQAFCTQVKIREAELEQARIVLEGIRRPSKI